MIDQHRGRNKQWLMHCQKYFIVMLILWSALSSHTCVAKSNTANDKGIDERGNGQVHQDSNVNVEKSSSNHLSVNANNNHTAKHRSYQVAGINYESIQTPLAITLWIFIATLAKIGFHIANKLSSIFPESCLLIVLGVVLGLMLFYTHLMIVSPLTPFTFFNFLLPLIVVDAGYFMPNRSFFDNIGTILLFAVVGTILNTVAIAVSLWAVGLTGLYGVKLNILDSFMFSALISAVDPVAVLAVFEEIHVNEVLYIVVFGESLLNDAVTVVLYYMFEAYTEMGESNIGCTDVLLGFVSFFVVAVGGITIGIFWGFFTGFVTRFTHRVRVVEPLIVFVMAYLSHLTAQVFSLSSIMAVTFCGICSKNYVEANISLKSHTTLKYAMKMLSSISESVIFLFLGVATVNDEHDWNTWFIFFTVLFCTVYRALGVVLLTALANHFRVHKLNKVEEFVMAYSGLRGAVAFALALTINGKVVVHKSMFITATIAMVFFTVLFQGVTIKPLVQLLRVKQSEKRKLTMNERIHERSMDHLMAGIEELIGIPGNYYLRDKFKYYDHHYIRKWLVREHRTQEPKILETYSKLSVKDYKNAHKGLRENDSCIKGMPNGGMFLRVPTVNTDMSLAAIFRNYTQTNLNRLQSGSSQYSLTPNDTSCNWDMNEIEYSLSTKDLDDVRMHHILKDCMFKTPRRHRKYSRSLLYDEDIHPPFQHMVRMQIRHLFSEQHVLHRKDKRKKHSRVEDTVADESSDMKTNHVVIENGYAKSADHTVCTMVKEDSGYSYYNPALDEEDGIMFTAKIPNKMTSDVVDYKAYQPPSPPTQKTVAETQLPWRRVESVRDGRESDNSSMIDKPIVQHEFPFWVKNKDYNPYLSPTTTFLNKLDAAEADSEYHIFEDTLEEGSDEKSYDSPVEV
ncbi:Sodium hydrogen exchanger [Chamberlinius hualienensis]